jgi:hypothetical protein
MSSVAIALKSLCRGLADCPTLEVICSQEGKSKRNNLSTKKAGLTPASLALLLFFFDCGYFMCLTAWRHISSSGVLMAIVTNSGDAHAVACEDYPNGTEIRPSIEVLVGLYDAIASIEK